MDLASQSWLQPGEVVLYFGRQSLRRELLCTLPMFVGAAGCKLVLDFSRAGGSLSVTLLSALLLGVAIGLPQLLVMYRRFEVVLTNHRLIRRRGLFRQEVDEIAVAEIAGVDADKSGDYPFKLILTGGGSIRIRNLPRLDRLRDSIALARRDAPVSAAPDTVAV